MIKFKATKDGKPLLGFGLSEGNIEKLQQGLPIMIDLADMDAGEGKVIIFYGGTDEELVEMCSPLLQPETEIHEQKKYHEG